MRRKNEWKNSERISEKGEFLNRDVMSVNEWMVTMILVMIPLVNLVMLIRWAAADRELMPANKVNWARGSLVAIGAIMLSASFVMGIYVVVKMIGNS